MLIDLSTTRVFIRPGYTDLRKATQGLSVLVQDEMACDPFSDSVFFFCNRERKLLKGLWWDRTGFWLCQKRLEKARFPWPETTEAARELTGDELRMLLTGIDFWKAHQPVFYSKIR